MSHEIQKSFVSRLSTSHFESSEVLLFTLSFSSFLQHVHSTFIHSFVVLFQMLSYEKDVSNEFLSKEFLDFACHVDALYHKQCCRSLMYLT